MNDINKVLLIGRLTRDAELKDLTSTSLCKFSIAVNRRANHGGNWEDEAHFFDVELFGNLGASIHQYLRKGQQVAIDGSLKNSKWQDADGNNRSRVIINASSIQLLGRNLSGEGRSPDQEFNRGTQQRNQNNQEYAESTQGAAPISGSTNAKSKDQTGFDTDFQDDIPF